MNYDIVLKYVQQVAGLSYYIDMEHLLAAEPERAKEIFEDGIREELTMPLMFFEKGFEAMKDSAVEFNRLLFDVLAHQVNTLMTHYCYFGKLEEALAICDWCEGILNAYVKKPEFVMDVLPWVWKKFNFSKMSAYLRAGKEDAAKEVCNPMPDDLTSDRLVTYNKGDQAVTFLYLQKRRMGWNRQRRILQKAESWTKPW